MAYGSTHPGLHVGCFSGDHQYEAFGLGVIPTDWTSDVLGCSSRWRHCFRVEEKAMRVLILGCGPAGLFATHAAEQLGHEIQIISKKRKSEMFGAQYLHKHIPGLTDLNNPESFQVTYTLTGTLDEYLHKVYGDEIPDNVTVDSLERKESAWDIRSAYAIAWHRYVDAIEPIDLTPDVLMQEVIRRIPDIVISTIPAPRLCIRNGLHSFVARDIWAIGDAPERGIFAPRWAAPNTIAYDGTPYRRWYRASNIARYYSVEWPIDTQPPIRDVSMVVKPIRTDCDCWVNNGKFWRIGRYGAWSRFGHTHQAYWR